MLSFTKRTISRFQQTACTLRQFFFYMNLSSALFFKESAILPSWNLNSESLKMAVHCPNPCLSIPSCRNLSSSVVNFKIRRWLRWMRKGVVEETTFLGGMIVLSAVSTKGDELEVEQPNLVWTSLSTSDPWEGQNGVFSLRIAHIAPFYTINVFFW